jgi:hypothetical protein
VLPACNCEAMQLHRRDRDQSHPRGARHCSA